MTSEEFFETIDDLWKKSIKETRYEIHLGRLILYYNPYDEKESAEAERLFSIYYNELKNGRDAAEKKVIEEAKTL